MDSEYTRLRQKLEVRIDEKECTDNSANSHIDKLLRKLEADLLTDMIAGTDRVLQNVPDSYANSLLKKLGDILKGGEQAGEDKDTAESSTEDLQFKHHAEVFKRPKPFLIMIDASGFLPNELEVSVADGQLVVHGKHGPRIDAHGEISRTFTRKFEIPEDVDIETFRSIMDSYDVLTVEVSRKPANERNKTIDIIVEADIDSKNPLLSLKYTKNLSREGFEKLIERHIVDGENMAKFAEMLSKTRPSDYIPLEKII